MNRRFFLALGLIAPFVTARVHAQAAVSRQAQAAISVLDDGLLNVMRVAKKADFAQRTAQLKPIVEKVFDLPLILKNSVGPRFASFPEAQQAELLDVFTQFTVASYVANFDDYNGERFDVLPDTRKVGGDEVVQTLLVPSAGDAIKLDYVMRETEDGWKVVDVLFNGSISRVAVQRSDFRSLVTSGDPSSLISSLRSKVARLAAGETS